MSAGFLAVGFKRGDLEKETGLDSSIFEDHRQRIHKHLITNPIPGFCEGIVANGKLVYLDICGFSNKERTTKYSERTLFRGNSMMKPITATAFMMLVDEGRVRLDDDLSLYIPKFEFVKVMRKNGIGVEPLRRQITLRHLLMHTSGLGYGPGSLDPSIQVRSSTKSEKLYKDIGAWMQHGEIDSLESLCDALCEKPLLFQPGTAYEYGLGMDVIGRVIEIITGRSLRHVIQERILTPTGMLDTTWDVSRASAKRIAPFYRLLRDPSSGKRFVQRLDGATSEDSAYVRGSAAHFSGGHVPSGGGLWGHSRTGLLFSMRDVALFCQMLLNRGVSCSGQRILKESTVRLLGRNWFEMKRSVDKPMPPGWTSQDVGWSPLGHVQLTGPCAGAIFMGGMSYFWLIPQRNIAAVMMTEVYWQVTPLGWKDDLDNMEKVIERAAQAAKKRKATRTAKHNSPRKSQKTL